MYQLKNVSHTEHVREIFLESLALRYSDEWVSMEIAQQVFSNYCFTTSHLDGGQSVLSYYRNNNLCSDEENYRDIAKAYD